MDLSVKNNENILAQRILITGFTLLSVWMLMLSFAPMLMNSGSYAAQYAATIVYFMTDPVCHQLPERSLFISGIPMPVCARCYFIYLGGWTTFLIPVFSGKINFWRYRVYLIMGIIILAEFVSEKTGLYQNLAGIRMIAGFLLGILIFRLIIEALNLNEQRGTEENG